MEAGGILTPVHTYSHCAPSFLVSAHDAEGEQRGSRRGTSGASWLGIAETAASLERGHLHPRRRLRTVGREIFAFAEKPYATKNAATPARTSPNAASSAC